MIAWVETDLPEPDSPTMPRVLPDSDGEGHALDGLNDSVVRIEGDPEVDHLQQRHAWPPWPAFG